MRTCGWKVNVSNAVSRVGEPTPSYIHVSSTCLMYTDGRSWGALFPNGFLAGLNTDSSVNVILAP